MKQYTKEIPKDSPVYAKFGVRFEVYSNFTYNKMISSDLEMNIESSNALPLK